MNGLFGITVDHSFATKRSCVGANHGWITFS